MARAALNGGGWKEERPRAAEFFAGIGLVRTALEREGFEVAFANDIEPVKERLYSANFPGDEFVLDDIRNLTGEDVPDVALATASFPCTDLSLAGNRAGLAGDESSMFWEFARVLDEMGHRKPFATLLENVPSWGTSHGGDDLRTAIRRLNELGYICDLFILDARRFVPQSRPRLFIVGSQEPLAESGTFTASELRPPWISRFLAAHPKLHVQALPLENPPRTRKSLASVVERLPANDCRWWDSDRITRFVGSLSAVQTRRLAQLESSKRRSRATAYRRTRAGRAVWEVRADGISGCLRTARGGSSKQALVEAGGGQPLRVRWMTPREYARLQGATSYRLGAVSDNQALFGLGDAVCVPVIGWITRHYLWPLVTRSLTSEAVLAGAA